VKASGNTETEFAARLRKIATAPRPLVIRVEEAKGAPGFTADRGRASHVRAHLPYAAGSSRLAGVPGLRPTR
jgi:hypothetical protein